MWDADPCCLEEDEWKIVLPTTICDKHDLETFNPALQLRLEIWNKIKKNFFKVIHVDKQELIDGYLEMFPEDKELINREFIP